MKTEMLAPRPDRLRNVFRRGCRHHEHDVRRWFLQGLEQRIERSVCNLVGLVENVNLEAVACRTIPCRLPQLANLIDAAVRCSVNFNHIDRTSSPHFSARFANPARFRYWPVGGAAIQSHCENAGNGRLTNPSMPAEDIAMSNPLLLDGIFQCTCDMVLANYVREALRTVFARQDLVAHGETQLYRPLLYRFSQEIEHWPTSKNDSSSPGLRPELRYEGAAKSPLDSCSPAVWSEATKLKSRPTCVPSGAVEGADKS